MLRPSSVARSNLFFLPPLYYTTSTLPTSSKDCVGAHFRRGRRACRSLQAIWSHASSKLPRKRPCALPADRSGRHERTDRDECMRPFPSSGHRFRVSRVRTAIPARKGCPRTVAARGQTPAGNAAVSSEASPDRTAPAPWPCALVREPGPTCFEEAPSSRTGTNCGEEPVTQHRRGAMRAACPGNGGSRFWRSSILAFFKHGGTHRKTPGVCQGFSEGQRATIGSVFLNVGLAVSSSGERSPGPTCNPPACRPWHSSTRLP